MVAATAECALKLQLSPGNAGDAPQGRRLLLSLEHFKVENAQAA
jgi:hypothetical protein